MKLLINTDFGGFHLSEDVCRAYEFRTGKAIEPYDADMRYDHFLIALIEEMGNKGGSPLAVRELPAGTRYRIHEYDGSESIVLFDEEQWLTA